MSDGQSELPRSRAEAKEIGSKHFFTGKPCKRDHVSKRLTSSGQCVECSRLLQRENPWGRTEKGRAYHKAYREAHKEESNQRSRQWRLDHPGEVSRQVREWKLRNPEKVAQYLEENKDLAAVYSRNRRARIKGNGGSHTKQDIDALLKSQMFCCAGCGCCIEDRSIRQVDHIVPIARGGTNDPDNLQILCKLCNMEKGTKPQEEFDARKKSPRFIWNHHNQETTMAGLGQKFNPTEHDTDSQREYDNLPDGIYILEVTSSDVKSETNKTVLKVTYDVIEPEQYKGRKIFGNFNLENPNSTAMEIGQRQFASLCRALEISDPVEDSEELHFKAFTAKVGMGKPSKDGQYAARNEIKAWYYPDNGNLPTPEITGPVTKAASPANDNRRPAANDNAPAAGAAKRPWGKK